MNSCGKDSISLLSSSDDDSPRTKRSRTGGRDDLPVAKRRRKDPVLTRKDSIEDFETSSEETEEWAPSPPSSSALAPLSTPQQRVPANPRSQGYFTPQSQPVSRIPTRFTPTQSSLVEAISDSDSEELTPLELRPPILSVAQQVTTPMSARGRGPISPSPARSISFLAEEIVESSDEEDSSLFLSTDLPTRRQTERAPSPVVPEDLPTTPNLRKWLSTIATPEGGTQGERPRIWRRKGPQVTRLHDLIQTRKAEETAAKHIIAARYLNEIPVSSNLVVIQSGKIVGNLYKTISLAVDGEGYSRTTHVFFPLEQKIHFGLQPNVQISLIPPWQEFEASEGQQTIILCSTFELLGNQTCSVTSLTDSIPLPKPLFCESNCFLKKRPFPQKKTESSILGAILTAPEDCGLSKTESLTGEVLLWNCRYQEETIGQLEALEIDLVSWFEGVSITQEGIKEQNRTSRLFTSTLLLKVAVDNLVLVEISPQQLWKWYPVLKNSQGSNACLKQYSKFGNVNPQLVLSLSSLITWGLPDGVQPNFTRIALTQETELDILKRRELNNQRSSHHNISSVIRLVFLKPQRIAVHGRVQSLNAEKQLQREEQIQKLYIYDTSDECCTK